MIKKSNENKSNAEKEMGVELKPTAKIDMTRKGLKVMKSKMTAITRVDVAASKEKLSLLFKI